MLEAAWQHIAKDPWVFGRALGVHVSLSLLALLLASLVALPLAVWLNRRGGLAVLVGINVANIGRTLPSLAVLALAMPVLGTGFTPSLFALTLLALPPILINAYTGLHGVEADVTDAARGMGLTTFQVLRQVEMPIALPVIFAGLRTAAVQVVSGAVLAAFIGGGGLGDYITAGIAMMSLHLLLVGAIPVTLLSIGADALFGLLQRRVTPKGLRA
ncbi:MAG: ABC transporter permease [Burkholderiaceae bacterium]